MISVCIPTFNGAPHIEGQLRSILSQLGPGDEVIVSDDGSDDGTVEVIGALDDPRVKVFIHPPIVNRFWGTFRMVEAVRRNLENALSKASGEVIFLSDQDDLWLPGKVARMMREFERGAELVMHDNVVVDADGRVLLPSYFSLSRPSLGLTRFLVKSPYLGASMAFTRRVADRSLPFPSACVAHDHWVAIVAWMHGKNICFVGEPLMLYRRHGGNASPTTEKSRNSLAFKIGYRVHFLRAMRVAIGRCRKPDKR